ncbi:hypothetical protein [Paraflavitalea speifideaquila]|uniref:hypothetical protein n=1 Tax=Paraflavitalea speifideaquila TaxID=3076558 RepID=UPI0028EF66C6|nr:hypothetical protein [Paraflavitalea speifideiaquila]
MRKTKAKKIAPAPDAKYSDALVTRFVNNLMWQGKKNTAFTIFMMQWIVYPSKRVKMVTKYGKSFIQRYTGC